MLESFCLDNADNCVLVDQSFSSAIEKAKSDSLLMLPLNVCDVITAQDEVYNEEFLASLRDEILQTTQDLQNKFGSECQVRLFLCPHYENNSVVQVTEATKHAARRLKDCSLIQGIVIPSTAEFMNEENMNFFVDEIRPKHKDYVFAILG